MKVEAYNSALVLADGTVFYGHGVGRTGISVGEMCFTTGMTGYQETLMDPSFAGQIITFTFPHIGNVGCNDEDVEAREPFASGLVIRDSITSPSSWRAAGHFNDWLKDQGFTGISGVDTRALTRHLREKGAQNGVIQFADSLQAIDLAALHKQAQSHITMEGLDLAKDVTIGKPYEWTQGVWKHVAESVARSRSPLGGEPANVVSGGGSGRSASATATPHDSAVASGSASSAPPQGGSKGSSSRPYHVVAIDYGAKLNILRCLAEVGCRVTVVPAKATAEEVLRHKPDGIFLANGPADPAATAVYAVPEIKKLVASGIPLFGICLGHQMLALALGAKTIKMHQGHRGVNHPVKDLETGRVFITSQNHGFVVENKSLPKDVIVTHLSLFDGTVEGLRIKDRPVFSVQFHPEASPGPHESFYLFERFAQEMQKK